MATSIKLKHSNTIATIPTTSDLIAGEVALNTVDKKFYVRNGSSSVVTLANHYATDFDVNIITFKVVVATKDSSHPYNGTGSSLERLVLLVHILKLLSLILLHQFYTINVLHTQIWVGH